jgi:hypothetical protein
MTILSARLKNKKSGAQQQSWAPDSTTRRATYDDDRLQVPSTSQELSDHVSGGGQPTSYDNSNWRSNATTDQDSNDYLIIQITPWWDPNNEARRINMIGHSNQKTINSSSKYPVINRSSTTECGLSSSSRTPPQPGPTAGPNLQDRSGLQPSNWCTLSDRKAMHHHLRKKFKPN